MAAERLRARAGPADRRGRQTVVFDLNFPTPSEDDDAFRGALERHADRVVIGSNFTSSPRDDRRSDRRGTDAARGGADPADGRAGPSRGLRQSSGRMRMASSGARNSIRTSRNSSARQGDFGETNYASLAAQAVRKFGRPDLVPTDNESHAFRYTAGPGQGFPARSIFEIFVPEYWERNFRLGCGFRRRAGGHRRGGELAARRAPDALRRDGRPGDPAQCHERAAASRISAIACPGLRRWRSGWRWPVAVGACAIRCASTGDAHRLLRRGGCGVGRRAVSALQPDRHRGAGRGTARRRRHHRPLQPDL